ncbi:hypothetical protein EV196_10367 [Mariniflexile fucanivorans]|uniref:Dolichyl-phosphate-mannose-protein mannosyltransferase n=1 Tax=Mariniflexile fucanivorans TaxID=264023 RepID=A0A4R1RKE8_9FLAO|nr:hypothetical protein [Mariniflexile fucanivorans]TCL66658.1 hypothetical protein EV196_10367 [Mariniflexile fucanivorans]
MFNLKKPKDKEFYFITFMVVILQIILSFQGFDVCDDGFVLTFYQQIYNAPESVEYNFVYWLSGVVGGAWYKLYENGGVLWLRFLAIIFNTFTFVVSYKILKTFINEVYALLGLTIVLFVNDFGFLTFYHNYITALLAVMSISFFLKGIMKSNYNLLIIAGFLLGINVFSRIPNVTLFVFILVIPYAWYLQNKMVFKTITAPIFGIILGFITVYILLLSLNQVHIMKNSLLGLVNLGKTEGSSHNVLSLFYTYLHNYIKLVVVFCQLLIFSIAILSVLHFFKNNRFIKGFVLILISLLLLYWFKSVGIFIIYVIGYIGTLGVLFTKQIKQEIKLLAFLALLMMLFLPLGSSGGIRSSGYMCIWLAIPLFFHFISHLEQFSIKISLKNEIISKDVSKNMIKFLSLFLLLIYSTQKIYSISQEAYFDQGSRFNKTYMIDSELAKGVYTTKERSVIINDLLHNLKKYVKPNDYLLTYDKIPMIHFLTETKPYMYNPWIWIYDSYSFKKNMERAETEIDVLPVIVQQKFETIFYFSEPTEYYLNDKIKDDIRYNNGFDSERVKLMNSFILRNDYEIVWSNAYFNIFKSNKK